MASSPALRPIEATAKQPVSKSEETAWAGPFPCQAEIRLNTMTAPGGTSGESAHDDEVHSPPTGEQGSEPSNWPPPWDAPPPAADGPPTPYPPSGSPPGDPPGHPPPGVPPGYQPPPGYAGPPYQPPPQLGEPPAGYPPPGYQGSYGPQGEMQPGMNGLAIASLISSFTGLFCCIGGILAIVLGAVAMGQIKRTHQDGYALAVAGIVIGVAALIVNLVVVIFALPALQR
jgi:hypothetical protein